MSSGPFGAVAGPFVRLRASVSVPSVFRSLPSPNGVMSGRVASAAPVALRAPCLANRRRRGRCPRRTDRRRPTSCWTCRSRMGGGARIGDHDDHVPECAGERIDAGHRLMAVCIARAPRTRDPGGMGNQIAEGGRTAVAGCLRRVRRRLATVSVVDPGAMASKPTYARPSTGIRRTAT
jgi:hypothetical protein